jgi:8-oxo-dGTP pyrophosphatase MutT (NUDIX family)
LSTADALPREPHALRRLIEQKLQASRPPLNASLAWPAGLTGDSDAALRQYFPVSPVAAAVLIPIVERGEGLTVLLTQRSLHLRNHAGQISFPGGRVEASDPGPLHAALREAEEEIGLAREYVEVVGYLSPQLVLSGFWITPVVGFVRPGFGLQLDASEVQAVFEVPLLHILDPANHCARERRIGDVSVQVYDIPFEGRNIWGATAGMLVALQQVLAASDPVAGGPMHQP